MTGEVVDRSRWSGSLTAATAPSMGGGGLLFIREVSLRETILHDDELDPEVVAELGIDQPGGVR